MWLGMLIACWLGSEREYPKNKYPEMCRSWAPKCLFYLTLLIKASHQNNLESRVGKLDSTTWWRSDMVTLLKSTWDGRCHLLHKQNWLLHTHFYFLLSHLKGSGVSVFVHILSMVLLCVQSFSLDWLFSLSLGLSSNLSNKKKKKSLALLLFR